MSEKKRICCDIIMMIRERKKCSNDDDDDDDNDDDDDEKSRRRTTTTTTTTTELGRILIFLNSLFLSFFFSFVVLWFDKKRKYIHIQYLKINRRSKKKTFKCCKLLEIKERF